MSKVKIYTKEDLYTESSYFIDLVYHPEIVQQDAYYSYIDDDGNNVIYNGSAEEIMQAGIDDTNSLAIFDIGQTFFTEKKNVTLDLEYHPEIAHEDARYEYADEEGNIISVKAEDVNHPGDCYEYEYEEKIAYPITYIEHKDAEPAKYVVKDSEGNEVEVIAENVKEAEDGSLYIPIEETNTYNVELTDNPSENLGLNIMFGAEESSSESSSESSEESSEEESNEFEEIFPNYETCTSSVVISQEIDEETGETKDSYDYFVTSPSGIKIKVKPCDWDEDKAEVTNDDLIAKSGVKTGKAKSEYDNDRIVLNDGKDIEISVPSNILLYSIEITGAGHKGDATSIVPAETEANMLLDASCDGTIAKSKTYESTVVKFNITGKATKYTITTGDAKVWASIKFVGIKVNEEDIDTSADESTDNSEDNTETLYYKYVNKNGETVIVTDKDVDLVTEVISKVKKELTYVPGDNDVTNTDIFNDFSRYMGAIYRLDNSVKVNYNNVDYTWDSNGVKPGSNFVNNQGKTLVSVVMATVISNIQIKGSDEIVVTINNVDVKFKFTKEPNTEFELGINSSLLFGENAINSDNNVIVEDATSKDTSSDNSSDNSTDKETTEKDLLSEALNYKYDDYKFVGKITISNGLVYYQITDATPDEYYYTDNNGKKIVVDASKVTTVLTDVSIKYYAEVNETNVYNIVTTIDGIDVVYTYIDDNNNEVEVDVSKVKTLVTVTEYVNYPVTYIEAKPEINEAYFINYGESSQVEIFDTDTEIDWVDGVAVRYVTKKYGHIAHAITYTPEVKHVDAYYTYKNPFLNNLEMVYTGTDEVNELAATVDTWIDKYYALTFHAEVEHEDDYYSFDDYKGITHIYDDDDVMYVVLLDKASSSNVVKLGYSEVTDDTKNTIINLYNYNEILSWENTTVLDQKTKFVALDSLIEANKIYKYEYKRVYNGDGTYSGRFIADYTKVLNSETSKLLTTFENILTLVTDAIIPEA